VKPAREIGETFVRLEAQIDNHSHSTGQIDIEASWTDRVDRLTDPGPTDEAHAGRVFSHRPRYSESLAKLPINALDDQTRPKQDFADTKHRFVKYRPDGTTRYREYFPASLTSDRNNILYRGEETEVNVLSSARPVAPEILYVIPTFRWETEVPGAGPGKSKSHYPDQATSRRIGRGLRVYLSRPWFSSGVGELLGVVIPKDSSPTDAARRYISEWGADPIWNTSGPKTQLAASDFTNSAKVSTDPLSIAEDSSVEVHAVGFNVEYNAERQVWFTDIEMGPVASYTPFVRLALARYQPDSIEGAHLSPIVRAEFAQLANDRTATLQFQAETLRVTVSGIAARNKLGENIAAATPSPVGPTPVAPPGYQYDPDAGAGRLVTVHVEQRGPGKSDFEWERVADPAVLPSFSPFLPLSAPDVLWTAEIPLPARVPASFERRLIIQEIEVFQTDPDPGVAEALTLDGSGSVPLRGRVVYLDVIALSDLGR
jgi:hypothetical protein